MCTFVLIKNLKACYTFTQRCHQETFEHGYYVVPDTPPDSASLHQGTGMGDAGSSVAIDQCEVVRERLKQSL